MNGKSKCRILKDIRKKIAHENDIEYVTTECKFKGNCSGTCPKCESEVRYLEEQLAKRKAAGKAVAVAGIATAMVVTAAGCDLFESQKMGEVPYVETETQQWTGEMGAVAETTEPELEGRIPTGAVDAQNIMVIGEVPYEETYLTGDVAWPG